MIDCDDQSEPHGIEYAEHKRRREQRKREKMLLLEAGCSLPKVDLTNVTYASEVPNIPDSKKRTRNRRKFRARKTGVSEVDGECSTITPNYYNPEVPPELLLKAISNVTIELNNLKFEITNQQTCSAVSNDTQTPKKQKNKNKTLTVNSTRENGINYPQFVSDSKLMYSTKTFTPQKQFNNSPKEKNRRSLNKNSESEKNVFSEYISQEDVKKGLASGELFTDYIRINPKDFKLGYIKNPIKEEQDILIISVRDRNGALEGDKVVVKLKPESEWKTNKQKTGIVVHILERVHPRTAIGALKLMPDKNKRFALFYPRDSRVPRIKIPFTDWPVQFFDLADQYEKVLFLGKITSWIDPRFAIGTIIENVGMSGDIRAETRAILAEHSLDVSPYSDEMKKYFPQSGKILEKEYEYRMDLRKECIFTIDPLTARDLDDAVSCKELPNGNFEVGVHISDVTYYLQEDTPLDKIVSEKATSIYMVESVYHMLPKELCMMCSLLPGEDKLAFSVFWEMTPEGKVISHKFSRSVINSCVQLAYEHAQMMIDAPDRKFALSDLPQIHNGFAPDDLTRTVTNLQTIAVNLRESRFQSGALRIDQPKVHFSLDVATCLPTSYSLYENKDCHRLIEEFMLLANITVATRLRNDYPNIAFLRCHAAPIDHMMLKLKSNLEIVGIHLDISSAGGLQQSLCKYSGEDNLSQTRMLVLNLLCAKPMNRARYFCTNNSNDTEDHWHYALSIPLYTHFTSPIRRYADIVVHRQLAGSLGYREKPEWSSDYVMEIAANCNKQKFNAKRAGEQSIELYLIQYIDQNQPVIEKAVVMDVKDNSFDAIVLGNGLTVRIYLNNLDEGVKYQFLSEDNNAHLEDEDKKLMNLILEWPAKDGKSSSTQIIAMFSVITVALSKKNNALKLETKLMRPEV